MDTICDTPAAMANPYGELQNILLWSYSLSATQKITCLLDQPDLGSNKPSILMDQLITLKPDLLDDVV